MKKILIALLLLVIFSLIALCAKGQEKKINIIPFPVLATNPTVGFAFGFSPGFTWYMGDRQNTSMSSAVASLVYTTNKQLFFSVRGNTFLEGDKWNLLADLRYQITSQPTYGLGTNNRSVHPLVNNDDYDFSETHYLRRQEMMEYDFIRAYLTLLKKHEDTRFFYGLGYHLDVIYNINDHLLNLDKEPQDITNHYRYNTLKGFSPDGNTVSGVSLNAMFDSRDNVANPYSGRYAFASWRANPKMIGSTKSSSTLWLEYRDYFNLSEERPRHLIGIWTYGWFVTSGDVPYMNLPAIGWDKFSRSGRGYTSGRFRGEDLVYTEVEYRFPLQKNSDTLGGVIFANTATASSRTENVDLFQHVNLAYGVGLRVMINKRSRSNVNLDYAWATNGSQGLFISLNEAF